MKKLTIFSGGLGVVFSVLAQLFAVTLTLWGIYGF
ncbi:hypothetical protein BASU183_01365 [Bacillus subtilis]